MTKYFKYFKYVLEHKWFVLIECWREGLYWQGITHDLSKFSLPEFSAYAWIFFATSTEKAGKEKIIKRDFSYAWLRHQHKNKHHWGYWVVDQHKKEALPIPEKYVMEMICDWRAMARKFGDTTQEYFQKNSHKIVLHPETLKCIRLNLYK